MASYLPFHLLSIIYFFAKLGCLPRGLHFLFLLSSFFSPCTVHVRPSLTKNETDLEDDHPLSLTALYLFSCFRYFLCRRCQCWDSRSLSRSDLPELRVRNKGWKAWWKELKN